MNGNKDGMTTIFEIGAYIDELVPKATQEEFNFAQIPQMNLQGNFPLGIIE